jgi:hypothetical protein
MRKDRSENPSLIDLRLPRATRNAGLVIAALVLLAACSQQTQSLADYITAI